MSSLLIGCYTPDRGRGTGITAPDGRIIPTPSPSFVILHPHLPVVYAVGEEEHGTVSAWSYPDWTPLGTGDTGGADPCHLAVDGDSLVTVNYSGGSISVHALDGKGRIGRRTDLVLHTRHGANPRQDSAHTHQITVTPDGLIVTDLGGDAIYHYHITDGRLFRDRIVNAPAGSGPRHVRRVGNRWMVAAELSAAVLVYDADWSFLGEVSASRSDGHNDVSELVATDDYLYVANRGPNTVSVFTLAGELPGYVTEVPVAANPRYITLDRSSDPATLYIASQDDDVVQVMRIGDDGIPALVDSIATPSPTCVVVLA